MKAISNEYQHDRVKVVSRNVCILVLWTKVVSVALEGLIVLYCIYCIVVSQIIPNHFCRVGREVNNILQLPSLMDTFYQLT